MDSRLDKEKLIEWIDNEIELWKPLVGFKQDEIDLWHDKGYVRALKRVKSKIEMREFE